MNVGYESLVWINDRDGKEYACSLFDLEADFKDRGELNEEERARCLDVNQLIGTERW